MNVMDTTSGFGLLSWSWKMNLVTKAVSLGSSFLLLCALFAQGSTHEGSEPEFDVDLPNLIVKQGSDVSYTCIVKRLGLFRVAWIRSEDKAIIALHNHMVTHNHRFSVTHNGHNTWTLHIKNVQQNDSGSYMCQINTDPQRSQYGTLDVVVPADIIDEETSNDVVVKEGQPATLKCKATGHPPPTIKWRREDNQPLPIGRERQGNLLEKMDVWEGESLPMRPLQRTDTGPYLCIANNSVPPRVSKRVMVYVHFHPSIKVSNQLVAAPAGVNVTLECFVEAVPRPAVSWFNKENQPILNKPGKVWQETEALKDHYSIRMKLTIANLKREDFTEYNCTAGNSIGSDYATIKLQQLHTPPTTRTTTTTKSPDLRTVKHVKHNNGLSERDSNGNPIKHSKNNKRNHTRVKTSSSSADHYHDEEFGGDVLLESGFTTSSSFSVTRRNQQKDSSPNNRRLDNPKFPGDVPSSSCGGGRVSPTHLLSSLKRSLLTSADPSSAIYALRLPQHNFIASSPSITLVICFLLYYIHSLVNQVVVLIYPQVSQF